MRNTDGIQNIKFNQPTTVCIGVRLALGLTSQFQTLATVTFKSGKIHQKFMGR